MPAFVLQALSFGVLGLCGVMLLALARVIYLEQQHTGQPRPQVLKLAYGFMSFCLALAVVNAYVQLHPIESPEQIKADQAKLDSVINALQADKKELSEKLRADDDRLHGIQSAMAPLLKVKGGALDELPDSSTKTVLVTVKNEIQKALDTYDPPRNIGN